VHGQELHMMEDKIIRSIGGIEFFLKEYQIISVVVQFPEGETGSDGVHDPEIQLVQALGELFRQFGVAYA
jgi:hypothetical protein